MYVCMYVLCIYIYIYTYNEGPPDRGPLKNPMIDFHGNIFENVATCGNMCPLKTAYDIHTCVCVYIYIYIYYNIILY